MCFIRVNTKHQPIKPPGAAPVLSNVYDKNMLETSVDIAKITSNATVAGLKVNEKLRPESPPSPPMRKVSVEEVTEKVKGKKRESLPQGRRSSGSSQDGVRRRREERKAMIEKEKERQRSWEILGGLQSGKSCSPQHSFQGGRLKNPRERKT